MTCDAVDCGVLWHRQICHCVGSCAERRLRRNRQRDAAERRPWTLLAQKLGRRRRRGFAAGADTGADVRFDRTYVFRLSRFCRRCRPSARKFRLWPRPSPGPAFRQPASGPHHRRIARYFEDHQAKPQSRAQGIARQRLCRGARRRRSTAGIASFIQRRPATRWRSRSRSLQSQRFAASSANCRRVRAPDAIAFLLAMIDPTRAGQGRDPRRIRRAAETRGAASHANDSP